MIPDVYIHRDTLIRHIQKLLKKSAFSGSVQVSTADIINLIEKEPIYNLKKVLIDVTSALVSDDPDTSCLTGDGTELVLVDKPRIEEVIKIIKEGGAQIESPCTKTVRRYIEGN